MPDLLRLIRPKKKLEQRVLAAQSGNMGERNALIQEYSPFVKKVLSQQLGRYIDEENDICYAVGLSAFNEAIDHYQLHRGAFLPFSAAVIRNRSIDQVRKDNRILEDPGFGELVGEDSPNVFSYEQKLAQPGPEEKVLLQEEIQNFVNQLEKLGVTLEDLIREAPRHVDTRRNAIRVARYLHDAPKAGLQAMKTGRMPMKDIVRNTGISKKAVSRSKKFILAVLLIMDSELDHLKQYIRSLEQEGQK